MDVRYLGVRYNGRAVKVLKFEESPRGDKYVIFRPIRTALKFSSHAAKPDRALDAQRHIRDRDVKYGLLPGEMKPHFFQMLTLLHQFEESRIHPEQDDRFHFLRVNNFELAVHEDDTVWLDFDAFEREFPWGNVDIVACRNLAAYLEWRGEDVLYGFDLDRQLGCFLMPEGDEGVAIYGWDGDEDRYHKMTETVGWTKIALVIERAGKATQEKIEGDEDLLTEDYFEFKELLADLDNIQLDVEAMHREAEEWKPGESRPAPVGVRSAEG